MRLSNRAIFFFCGLKNHFGNSFVIFLILLPSQSHPRQICWRGVATAPLESAANGMNGGQQDHPRDDDISLFVLSTVHPSLPRTLRAMRPLSVCLRKGVCTKPAGYQKASLANHELGLSLVLLLLYQRGQSSCAIHTHAARGLPQAAAHHL